MKFLQGIMYIASFWSGSRRRPIPINFDRTNQFHQLFLEKSVAIASLVYASKPYSIHFEKVYSNKSNKFLFFQDNQDHVMFALSVAKIVCQCYQIPNNIDYIRVKYVGGKMGISIITSTAAVAAITCLNYVPVLEISLNILIKRYCISVISSGRKRTWKIC